MAKVKSKKTKKSKSTEPKREVLGLEISPDRFDEMRLALRDRVKASRYRHSLGVSQTAEQLARIYGVDQSEAAVAGLLHDWDKSLTSDELKRKAKKLKLAKKEVRENAVGVLHSWTAAATLRDVFPDLSDAVLQAIGRHTCGEVGMSDLDMVIFVADIIEPGRNFPDIQGLRDAVGEVSLDELFYRTYKANFMYLLSADMVVVPPSLDVYNSLVIERKRRLAREEADKAEASSADEEASSIADEIERREALAQLAEQQIELAHKAACERNRVREEKRDHMNLEHAELYAPSSTCCDSSEGGEQEARGDATSRSQGDDGTDSLGDAQPCVPEQKNVARTPGGARIIPID